MIKTEESRQTVVGIGSALVDMLIRENEEFLKKAGVPKGGMTYVDSEFIESLLKQTPSKPSVVPGGSACNTIIGIGNLGGKARFVGKRGDDPLGEFFETGLKGSQVEPVLLTSPSPTGRVLSIITSDAQRSMLTCLGASAEITAAEIKDEYFKDAAIVHIEGYLLFNREVLTAVLESAKRCGARVSLDLANFTVVESAKDFLETLVADFVDILIANEDEAKAFTGHSDETEAIKSLSEKAEIAVLKVGKRGSFISRDRKIIKVSPQVGGDVVDTTGAGDLWASGFLFGLVKGYPLEKCGKIASSCGYEVCRVVGASIPEDGWERIRGQVAGDR